jgi:hypothetical protein
MYVRSKSSVDLSKSYNVSGTSNDDEESYADYINRSVSDPIPETRTQSNDF